MAEPESEDAWDEYQWERFLRQQDEKTEKYMELLEKYIDHPDRDEIVAREMGWSRSNDEEEPEWNAVESFEEEAAADSPNEFREAFERHPLYRASFGLTTWIDRLFDGNSALQNHPAAVKLATQAALATGKLAGALSDHETAELGMNIAYLKRGLKSIGVALEAAAELGEENLLSRDEQRALRRRLFEVRDGIIECMGEFRGEWRRRHGEH